MRAEVPPSNYRNNVPERHESETPPVESTEQWPSPTPMPQELRDATCPPPSEDEEDLPSESSDPEDQLDLHQVKL